MEKARARRALVVGGGLMGALLLAALAAYTADAGFDAHVRSTHCDARGSTVNVETRWLGVDHAVRGVPYMTCLALHPGNVVTYHIRTGRTILYASDGGDCVWDTAHGAC